MRAVGANKSRPPPSTAASNRSSLSPRRAPNLVVEWRYAGAPPFALTARDPFSPRSCLDPYPPSSPHPRPRLCECRSWDTPGFSPAHGRISQSPRGLPGHLHLARAAVSTPTPRPHVLARGPMSTDTSPSAHPPKTHPGVSWVGARWTCRGALELPQGRCVSEWSRIAA